jgi:hypothetical protein
MWGHKQGMSESAVDHSTVSTCKVESLPFLISDHCPNVTATQDRVDELQMVIEKHGKGLETESDRIEFARKLLGDCQKATEESFPNLLTEAGKKFAKIDEEAVATLPSPPLSVEDEVIHVLLFLAIKLPGLGVSEFMELAEKLITECDARYRMVTESGVSVSVGGEQTPGEGPELKEMMPLAMWQQQKFALIKSAGLATMSKSQRDASYMVVFVSQELMRIWRDYFNEAVFESAAIFRELRRYQFLRFVSDAAVKAVSEFYADMAVTDPHEFRSNCIPELVTMSRESEGGFVRARVAQIARALLKSSETANKMVGELFNELILRQKDYMVALEMVKGLAFLRGFDSYKWLKIIIEKTTQEAKIRKIIQEYLWRMMELDPSGPVPVLSVLLNWMSDEKYSQSSVAQFATSTARMFAQRSLGYLLMESDRSYPLLSAFSSLNAEQTTSELLRKVFKALMEPGSSTERAMNLEKHVGLELSLSNEQELAIILQSWLFMLATDASSDNPVYCRDRVENAMLAGIAEALDRSSRLIVAEHLNEGAEYAGGIRDWLLDDWEASEKWRSTFLSGKLMSSKKEVYELIRNHVADVMHLRRQILSIRDPKPTC